MKNKKGFTLVEVVIVIIIVGILSIVAVPIYNNYVEKAILSEGYALLSQVKVAQEVYYTEHDQYAHEGIRVVPNGKGRLLDIDAGKNKYFSAWYTADSMNQPNSGYDGYGLYAVAYYNGHKYEMLYDYSPDYLIYSLEFLRDGESISYEEWGPAA